MTVLSPEISPIVHADREHAVQRATEILRSGGLVAFPTETVYGLGADAANTEAVARIFAAKGRPADHPLIVHLGQREDLHQWARDIPPFAWRLVERFWPGPLTLILKRASQVPDLVTGGQDTVGLRMPDHPAARALLQNFGGGIAAPSANRFGRISPTTAEHVEVELGTAVDCILDGGPCAVGLESTILDLSRDRPQILRAGAITAVMIANTLGALPAPADATGPRAPGRLPSHYSPDTPLHLLAPAKLDSAISKLLKAGKPFAVVSMRAPIFDMGAGQWYEMPGTALEYARRLYACLRAADTADCECILVERPPAALLWEAVNDRLERAAFRAGPYQRGDL